MDKIAEDRGKTQARTMLYRFLEHRRSTLGLDPKQSVEPKQFFPVDPRYLVQSLGWNLEAVDMVGQTADGQPMLARCVKKEKKITILASLSEEVKRFTVAHELGHVLLHADIPDCASGSLPRVTSMMSASRKKTGSEFARIEREAERFACNLLMPDKAVRAYFRQLLGVERLLAGSSRVIQLAPKTHKNWSGRSHSGTQESRKWLRELAEEIATWRGSAAISLAEFFGVSGRASGNRLVELGLLY